MYISHFYLLVCIFRFDNRLLQYNYNSIIKPMIVTSASKCLIGCRRTCRWWQAVQTCLKGCRRTCRWWQAVPDMWCE